MRYQFQGLKNERLRRADNFNSLTAMFMSIREIYIFCPNVFFPCRLSSKNSTFSLFPMWGRVTYLTGELNTELSMCSSAPSGFPASLQEACTPFHLPHSKFPIPALRLCLPTSSCAPAGNSGEKHREAHQHCNLNAALICN